MSLDCLPRFVQEGGLLIFAGRLPGAAPGLKDDDTRSQSADLPIRLRSRPSLQRCSGTLSSAVLGDGEQGRTVSEVEA
jgi:hypothetical protein